MNLDVGIANAFSVLEPHDSDRVVVVYDSDNSGVARAFRDAALTRDLRLDLQLLQLDDGGPRLDRGIPLRILNEVRAFRPAIAINLLSPHICNIECRVALLRIEEELRCKVGHVPEGAEEIFRFHMDGDFQQTIRVNKRVRQSLSAWKPSQIRVTTEKGTNLVIDVQGREWLTDVVAVPGGIVNFPCGEVYVAPLESGVNGVLVCDVAIGDLGRVTHPVELKIEGGRCVEVRGEGRQDIPEIKRVLYADAESSVVGELGIGLNWQIPPSSQTTLLLEKAGGTCHLAFGANEDFGGKNRSSVHTDFVFDKASLFAGEHRLLEGGELRLESL